MAPPPGMQTSLLVAYLPIALFTFLILLGAFLLDSSTPKTHWPSWRIVLLGSAFWLVVIPLSAFEMALKLSKVKHCT